MLDFISDDITHPTILPSSTINKGISFIDKGMKDGVIVGRSHIIEAPPITDIKDIEIIGITVL
jgi:hypothetical protein